MAKQTKSWEEQFDEEYPIEKFLNGHESSEFDPDIVDFRNNIKSFISKVEEAAYERGKEEKLDIDTIIGQEIYAQGRKQALEEVVSRLEKYPKDILKLYDGKLPWVVFQGQATESEKFAIYEAAFKDFLGFIKKSFPYQP